MAGASVSCTHLRPRPATMMAAASPSSHRQLATLVSVSGGPLKPSILRIAGKPLSSASFTLRAAADDDGGLAVAEGEPAESSSVTGDLKQKLMGLLYGTDRGLKASSETRAEIVELITQLEANNPNPNPTDALPLLNGKWILAYDGYSFLEFLDRLSGTGGVFYRYTSFSQMFPLLGSGRLPALVKVGEISQTIDSEEFTVQNSVQLVGPLGSSPVTTNAKFEIRSPKSVQIKFEEGIIGTPQLTDSIVIPEKVQFMGQNVDLSPLSGVITSIQAAGLPPIKFSIDSSKAESWLLTTYLDEELRISRADGSSVFVLIKDGSPLLSQ